MDKHTLAPGHARDAKRFTLKTLGDGSWNVRDKTELKSILRG